MAGLVSAIYVEPPARVREGEPLFRVERDLSLASDGQSRGTFDIQVRDEQRRATEAQYRQRRIELEARLASARASETSRLAEHASIDEQGKQSEAITNEAARKLARLESVADYVGTDRIDDARAQVHQGRIAVEDVRGRAQQVGAAIEELRSAQKALAAQIAELDTSHARDLQDIDARFEQERKDVVIPAPRAGTVTFSRLLPGSTLARDDVAMVIVTGAAPLLRAALHIPSRRRGFVHAGQVVRLKFDAYPYARFGSYEARIDSVSRTTVTAGQEGADAASAYIAWITLPTRTFEHGGEQLAILPGMQASASIVIERRTIAEWVLEPLFQIMRG